VPNFGTSRSIPLDKTHLTTAVGGTMDPEYFQSSQFTDKNDVYSFSIVLVELITGRELITLNDEDESQNMTAHFISVTKDNQLSQILSATVIKEARKYVLPDYAHDGHHMFYENYIKQIYGVLIERRVETNHYHDSRA
jgi:hypothetical protein